MMDQHSLFGLLNEVSATANQVFNLKTLGWKGLEENPAIIALHARFPLLKRVVDTTNGEGDNGLEYFLRNCCCTPDDVQSVLTYLAGRAALEELSNRNVGAAGASSILASLHQLWERVVTKLLIVNVTGLSDAYKRADYLFELERKGWRGLEESADTVALHGRQPALRAMVDGLSPQFGSEAIIAIFLQAKWFDRREIRGYIAVRARLEHLSLVHHQHCGHGGDKLQMLMSLFDQLQMKMSA